MECLTEGGRLLDFICFINFSPNGTFTDIAVSERYLVITYIATVGIDKNELVINSVIDFTKASVSAVKTGKIMSTLIGIL